MKISNPTSTQDLADYFKLRWQVLREPWGHVLGSERDELEAEAWHLIAKENDIAVGVGRLHRSDEKIMQVRYMAVHPEFGGQGIGSAILAELEKIARTEGSLKIVLNARESAVSFYEENGYRTLRPGHVLWGVIPHFVMQKTL